MADAPHHRVRYGYCFLIVGNTDATGRRDYNLKLSERRAETKPLAGAHHLFRGIYKPRIDTLVSARNNCSTRSDPKAKAEARGS